MSELARIEPRSILGLARAMWEDYLRAFPTLPRDSHAVIKQGILDYATKYAAEIRKHASLWTLACGASSRARKPGLPQVMEVFETEMFHREALERRPKDEGLDCSVAELVEHIALLKSKYLPGSSRETAEEKTKRMAHEVLEEIRAKRSAENGEL